MSIDEIGRIRREIDRLERQLEQPIDPKQRLNIKDAIVHLRRKKSALEMPH